jgi:hypothetical protein
LAEMGGRHRLPKKKKQARLSAGLLVLLCLLLEAGLCARSGLFPVAPFGA